MNLTEWSCAGRKNSLCRKRVFLQNHDIMTGSIALGDAYAEVTESADLLRQYMKKIHPVIRV